MKDAATILKELGCGEASVNGYRNVEYDYTNLVLHFTEEGGCTTGTCERELKI